jgi:hypothetical protein
MFRLASRARRHRLIAALAAGTVLSGCARLAGEPLVFGSVYRSIKDDQAAEPVARAAPHAQQKAAAAKSQRRRVAARPASGRPADQPVCESQNECIVRLKALIDSPNRSWIGQPESPADHATGIRLFAYRALLGKLSCAELARAIDEISTAAAVFRAPVPGIDAQKAGRIRALNSAVELELRAERTRRCAG